VLAAIDAFTRTIPAVVLKSPDKVAHGAGIFGGAAGPDKTGFNAAIVSVGHVHDSLGFICWYSLCRPRAKRMSWFCQGDEGFCLLGKAGYMGVDATLRHSAKCKDGRFDAL
jgi:hypothetical protein